MQDLPNKTQSPKSRYSDRAYDGLYLYTKGNEYSLDGVNYIGEYHLDGVVPYTGPKPSNTRRPLRPIYSNQTIYKYDSLKQFQTPALIHNEPIPVLFQPLLQQYENQVATRYFVERTGLVSKFPIEINEQQAQLYGQPGGINAGLYVAVAIQWRIAGYEQDIVNWNQAQIAAAARIVTSIELGIRNYTEKAKITFN